MRAALQRWLGWTSPLTLAWLWHALTDGTPLCRCARSRNYWKAEA